MTTPTPSGLPQPQTVSCPIPVAPKAEPAKVFLVCTGEVYEGQETYTRHEAPPPLSDFETLYTTPQADSAQPTVEQAIASLVDALAESKGWMRGYAEAIVRDAIDFRGAKPEAEPAKLERLLRELLAVIHKDGGHHQNAVGTEQAVEDAIAEYHRLRAIEDSAQPVVAETLTDEQIVKTAAKHFKGYAYEAKGIFIAFTRDLLASTPRAIPADPFGTREFHDLCQAYRWTKEIDGPDIVRAFQELQAYCRAAMGTPAAAEPGKGQP